VPTVNGQPLSGYEKGVNGSGVPGSTIELPVIPGYTTTATPTVPATGGMITVTYTPNEVTVDVTIPSNLGPKTVSNVTGKTGDGVAVKVPDVMGYTPDKTTVPATVNPNGTIMTTAKVTYTPNEVTADVTIPSNLGPKVVSNVTGKTGDSVAVKVPDVMGYTPDKTTVPATVNPNGTITTTAKVTYTPNEVTADVTIPSNLGPQNVTNVTGKTGDSIAVKVPSVTGYTPDKTTVPATVNPNGTITTTAKVTYTPNTVTTDVTIPSNLGPKVVSNVTGKTGDSVTVEVPAVTGYTPDKTTVPATVNPNGTITTTAKVTYTPNEVTADITIPSNLGPKTVSNVTGKTGDSVAVKVPAVTGYTPDKTAVPATVNPNGTITTTAKVTYTPNEVTADVTIPSNLGPKTVSNVTGKTGDSVAVKVPSVTGYTPDKTTVPATVNPNGTITTTAKVTYTPNEVTADVTIPSNLGPKTVSNVTGKTGDGVAVKVPDVMGYTPDKTTVPATVNPDGTITTTAKVTYTPNKVTADVTIPSNLGPKTVTNITGKTGDKVSVTVPRAVGYTADKITVTATVNPDGTITTTEKVAYTPNQVTTHVTVPSNRGPQTVPNITGKTGEQVNVPVPTITGYTADKATVPATVNADGTITTNTIVTYLPQKAAAPVQKQVKRNTPTQTGAQATLPQTSAATAAWLTMAGLVLLGTTGLLINVKRRLQ
jgi:LPXTG-motif cell wall-anchored protein